MIKELDKAEEIDRRGKVINNLQDLLKQYEELINLKDIYLDE